MSIMVLTNRWVRGKRSMPVTAEGIETEAEREVLKLLGADVMQGYLGSRPLYGAALQAWLDGLAAADTA